MAPQLKLMARILLVDDEISIRRLLQTILAHEGHEVTTACDGNEGLSLVNLAIFDLVITDLIMPDKEGLEMIREIRKSHPNLKIIAMTGGGHGNPTEYLTWAKAFGVQETVLKPFTRDEMVTAVRSTLGTE